jgi:hypothetical protein
LAAPATRPEARSAGASARTGHAPDTQAQTGGTPLSPELRGFFEPRFGQDFSSVRLHADQAAAESARGQLARAYTLGEHIWFGQSQFLSATKEGKHLLAHELSHVLQQRSGATLAPAHRKVTNSAVDDPLEREADAAAEAVMRMPAADASTAAQDPAPAQANAAAPRLQLRPAPPTVQRKLSDEEVKRVEAEHRSTQQWVYKQIEPDTIWDYIRRGDPDPSTLKPEQRAKDPHVLFNNSVDWIRSRRITLNVLTPVPGEATDRTVAAFDPNVNYPDVGGSVDNRIDFEKNVDAKTDDKSMQLMVRPDLTVGRLRELMRHEIQHVADAHRDPETNKRERAEFEQEQPAGQTSRGQMNATIWNQYQTEFNAHWLESIARPAVQTGIKPDGSPAESGGSGPGGRSGYDKFGSDTNPGGELKVAGRDKLPEQSVKLQNEKQTNIARFIIGNYFGMEETFLASKLFRDKVQALDGPQTVNAVNSLRIERLRRAMHGPATRQSIWLRTVSREEDVANAVKALNDTDLAFLKDRGGGLIGGSKGTSAPFWDDARRQMSAEFFAWMESYIVAGNKEAPPPIPQVK